LTDFDIMHDCAAFLELWLATEISDWDSIPDCLSQATWIIAPQLLTMLRKDGGAHHEYWSRQPGLHKTYSPPAAKGGF